MYLYTYPTITRSENRLSLSSSLWCFPRELRRPELETSTYFRYCLDDIQGIMAEGNINKMADLQETKFLRLFGLTNVHF
jgi:hypothetical protein